MFSVLPAASALHPSARMEAPQIQDQEPLSLPPKALKPEILCIIGLWVRRLPFVVAGAAAAAGVADR